MRARVSHGERDDYLRIECFDSLVRKISSGIEGEPVIARRQARIRRKQIAQASVLVRYTFADVFPNSRRSLLLQHYGNAACRTARRNIQNVCRDGAHAFAVCELINRLSCGLARIGSVASTAFAAGIFRASRFKKFPQPDFRYLSLFVTRDA